MPTNLILEEFQPIKQVCTHYLKHPILGIGGPDKFKKEIKNLNEEFNFNYKFESRHHAHNNILHFLPLTVFASLVLIIIHYRWFKTSSIKRIFFQLFQ